MGDLLGALDIARRALVTQRQAMDVTSHNIANANTPGYTRQRPNLTPTTPLQKNGLLFGTGVTISTIERLRDKFVDQEIRGANQFLGSATQQKAIFSRVEAVFNEPSDSGLRNALDKFFAAFQNLAAHPEDGGVRQAVVQQAITLSRTFNSMSANLRQLQSDIAEDVETKVDQINQLLRRIADLNVEIGQYSGIGQEANDAKDQRDKALDELSKLVDVKAIEDSRGAVTVTIGGTTVVSLGSTMKLAAEVTSGGISIIAPEAGTSTNKVVLNVTSGEVGAAVELYNTTIPGFLDRLNTLALTLITGINNLHYAGYGLGTPPPTGNNFFTGTDASDIQVNSAILNDVNLIAASADGTPGNSVTASAIADYLNEPVLNGGTVSIMQYYTAFISDVAAQSKNASDMLDSQERVLTQLENQRESVSGVSIDEEMVNLIKFQRAFDAAARMVRTVDELYQTIINMVQ